MIEQRKAYRVDGNRRARPLAFTFPEQASFLDDAPFLRVALRRRVLEAAESMTGICASVILSPTREQDVVRVRWAAMVALRAAEMSLPQIARTLNRSDHTTVGHGLKQAAELRQTLPGYDRFCRALIAAVRGMA